MHPTLPIVLRRDDATSLGTQLAGQVRALVTDGTLARGHRMPSSRALAAELGVARSVVEQAYAQLVAEGWLDGRHGAGTFVAADAAPVPRTRTSPPDDEAPTVQRLGAGDVWFDAGARAGWRRAWREVSAARPPRGYDHPQGLPALRAAVAERLARTRGLAVDPSEVIVTAGTTGALRLLLAALPAGPVGVEDPGYRAAVATVRAGGRDVVDLPALDPARGLRPGLAACYVTPAHQHPLGHVMSAAHRLRLLDAARVHGTLVVEDDYDSELRYDVAPVPALATLDRDQVAYLGTASKSVVPGLRLGWMVVPPDLHDDVVRLQHVLHDVGAWPAQQAMLALLRDGWLDTTVRAARRVYGERALRVEAALGLYGVPAATTAGMYSTWLMLAERARAARDGAAAAGFDLPLLADYCRSAEMTGVVLGFGGVDDEALDRALAAIGRGLAG
ncbi:PLP-dependent aminotransferase family protein [Paraoerskovia marina]|uniref:aminotransferase-like domain-containing protein n=1 Tax=Paraoerskovia marina TaxID=545619 RepID=UPI000492C2A3|nr:PLP-dependent aminotransferase family protein [Paraoerskovia marina]